MSNESASAKAERLSTGFENEIRRGWLGASALKHTSTRRRERADLRRCQDLTSIIMCDGYQRTRLALIKAGEWVESDDFEARVAVITCVLSHINQDTNPKTWHAGEFASQLAKPSSSGGSRARLSGRRLRKILSVTEPTDLLIHMADAVKLNRREAPVASLARDIRWWGLGELDLTRRAWATRYYESAPHED